MIKIHKLTKKENEKIVGNCPITSLPAHLPLECSTFHRQTGTQCRTAVQLHGVQDPCPWGLSWHQ